jgi:actin-related protein 3
MAAYLPACVIDNGTGYSKLGFAGDSEPEFVIPSAIAVEESAAAGYGAANRKRKGFDSFIGDDALQSGLSVKYPFRPDHDEDWDYKELFWKKSISECLGVEPKDRYFLITEPPINSPANRYCHAIHQTRFAGFTIT